MLAFLLTFLISYLTTSLFAYIIHWSLHQPWAGKANASHMMHHHKYPPTNFMSKTYRDTGKDSTLRIFAVVSLPLIFGPIIFFLVGILPLYLLLTILVVEAIVGFIYNYLHDAFHINNHWLTRTPWLKDIFRIGIRLHFLHHVNNKTNYGIFDFTWDKLFKTFWKQ